MIRTKSCNIRFFILHLVFTMAYFLVFEAKKNTIFDVMVDINFRFLRHISSLLFRYFFLQFIFSLVVVRFILIARAVSKEKKHN